MFGFAEVSGSWVFGVLFFFFSPVCLLSSYPCSLAVRVSVLSLSLSLSLFFFFLLFKVFFCLLKKRDRARVNLRAGVALGG